MKFKLRTRDLGWNKIVKAIRASAGGTVLDVGVFDTGQPRQGAQATNAEIALVHEFGSPAAGIPERSFLRSTIDAHRARYTAAIKKIAAQVLKGKDTYTAMNLLGMSAAADVKRTIQQGVAPPLQPETIARKGSSKPLIDTGQLITSVTWRLFRVP